MAEAKHPQLSRWFKALLALCSGEPAAILSLLKTLLQHLPLPDRNPGIYEVLEYEARLELKDTRGLRALYHKRQRVRFLQDSVIAYQDTAWGDGDIFADYRCSPGMPVDRYREGHRYRILISLRGTKNRSDTEEFHIHREIRDGFVNATEDFQIEISHRTRKLSISIVFPLRRQPQEVMLIERNAARSKALGPEHQTQLSDGRQEYTWKTGKARIFEAYIVRWKW